MKFTFAVCALIELENVRWPLLLLFYERLRGFVRHRFVVLVRHSNALSSYVNDGFVASRCCCFDFFFSFYFVALFHRFSFKPFSNGNGEVKEEAFLADMQCHRIYISDIPIGI